jgi:hypothetical protein
MCTVYMHCLLILYLIPSFSFLSLFPLHRSTGLKMGENARKERAALVGAELARVEAGGEKAKPSFKGAPRKPQVKPTAEEKRKRAAAAAA